MPGEPDSLVRRWTGSGGPDDLAGLYRHTEGPSFEFLTGQLKQPTTRLWVVMDQESVVGAAWFTVIFDTSELVDIRIQDNHRGRGLGKKLLQQCLVGLGEEGVVRVHLEVRRSNGVARRLYSQLGFEQTGIRQDYYSGGSGREDAILMTLNTGAAGADS